MANQICAHCKDVILTSEDAVCIQQGYFNQYKEFVALGKKDELHLRCYQIKMAYALVFMEKDKVDKPGDLLFELRKEIEKRREDAG
jgi:hypothetical protein